MKPNLVLKFGGTSVGKASNLLRIVEIVRGLQEDYNVVVVLSAVSTYVKARGVTTLLLKAAEEVLVPGSKEYLKHVASILSTHLDLVEETMPDGEEQLTAQKKIKQDLIEAIRDECAKLRNFLEAAEVIEEVSPRSRDMIVSYGEKLSCLLFAALLRYSGISAASYILEKLVAKHFDPKNLTQEFYDYLSDRLEQFLTPKVDSEDCVSVVSGYFGPIPGSLLLTIGRGYTDLTAALVAVGIHARELQIWKEVDGIFTADPRKVPHAQHILEILPEEAAELTYYGSEVIHPFTVEQVIRRKISIRVKNTFHPERPGTLIHPDAGKFVSSATLTDERPHKRSTSLTGTARHAVSVTVKEPVHVLNIQSNRKSVSHGFLKSIFETLDFFGIVVDLISTSQVHVSMALSDQDGSPLGSPTQLECCIQRLRQFGDVTVRPDMAILSLVGRQMKNMVGMAAKMFSCLSENNINLEMISQGASEINISCVIELKDTSVALNAVHDACVQG